MIFLDMHFGLISMIRNIDQYDGQSYKSGLNLSYKHVRAFLKKNFTKMKKKLLFHFRILMYSKNESKITHMHKRSVI